MASPLEVKLCAKMDRRATLEEQMRTLLGCASRPGVRRMLVQRCMQWMQAHEECNESARELADSIEHERGAA
jgi:hypothetical protein